MTVRRSIMKEFTEALVIATLSGILSEMFAPLITQGFKHFGKKFLHLIDKKRRRLQHKR